MLRIALTGAVVSAPHANPVLNVYAAHQRWLLQSEAKQKMTSPALNPTEKAPMTAKV